MPEKSDPLTRKETEVLLYQLDTNGHIMASLMIGISDRLDTIIEQNKKIIEFNEKRDENV